MKLHSMRILSHRIVCLLSFTELASSVPCTEIVGKSDYFRFSMRDSLALEASFLQKKRDRKREKNLVTPRAALPRFPCAICCPRAKNRLRDPLPAGHSFSLRGEMFCLPTRGEGTRRHVTCDELYIVEEERVGVPVKGGLYEVLSLPLLTSSVFLKHY
ncbi:hypothetical protein BHE74_00057449 [Ensete ventricosum]|nr:hypothetical protein BHE74_00057449 [Ensete ventricosum]